MRLGVLALVCLARPVAADPCVTITDKPVAIATAAAAGEYTLSIELQSASATKWNEKGNEALVLEVAGDKRGFIGHLVVHQGRANFTYAMHLGALAANEALQLGVGTLSAAKGKHEATACKAQLAVVTDDAVRDAPIYRWPAQKRFDDLPMLVGWSATHRAYVTVMTNENGGTAEICGGGARGMQAEISRWGRSLDIEDHYHGGKTPGFERCTGHATAAEVHLQYEGAHPQLYYGNGHNRLFENRTGYGAACGKTKPERADGDLGTWSAAGSDDGKVIVLRPVPVDLDALGYPAFGGRREALADHYAPWLYRLTSLELEREGKLDGDAVLGMERYLYVDVKVAGVAGEGGTYCAKSVRGGFRLRAITKQGAKHASAQITAKYAFGGHHDWKRVAIPLPTGTTAADIDHFQFDAYDGNGIYVTAIGDAFIPKTDGDDGATLDYVRKGEKQLGAYVDDARAGCVKGAIIGPEGIGEVACAGGVLEIAK